MRTRLSFLLIAATLGCKGQPGACDLPPEAGLEDVSHPTTVVGDGTPASCTSARFEAAVQAGGVVTFDCGPDPYTLVLANEIRLRNDAGPGKNGDRVIDGGGKITLSGGGAHRMMYQNACDESLVWISDHCDDDVHPRLVVQNLIFEDGRASDADQGGGAIYVQGGILKIVNSTFRNNQIVPSGPDVAGGAVYTVLMGGPVYVVRSVFQGNSGANGGALGSIGTSTWVFGSTLESNSAIGTGMNSGNGGNGGAIYNDGDTYVLRICGSTVSGNAANELGGAVFYVSNDMSGELLVDRSTFRANTCQDPQDPPGFFVQAAKTDITRTTFEP